MGLIKAGMGALGGTLADQWKEFFYCDALDKDVLMVKGQKRTSRRSSNNGEDNIITNGSGIAVADGQCMLIVEQGRVVEVCAEPGEYTFNSSTEPSVFTGNFGDSLAATFQTVAKRFTYGGDTGKDQRVYYINTKELGEILYGTATPIPFRVVVSEERGYKLSVNIRCNGSFTYRICDPLLFYTNVCSNVSTQYDFLYVIVHQTGNPHFAAAFVAESSRNLKSIFLFPDGLVDFDFLQGVVCFSAAFCAEVSLVFHGGTLPSGFTFFFYCIPTFVFRQQ